MDLEPCVLRGHPVDSANRGGMAFSAGRISLAADQGIADGQCLLGTLFADGNGVVKDNVAAYEWMTLAAQNGNADCSQGISHLLPQMTPEQIAEAKRRVASWTPKPHPQFNY